MAQYHYKVGEDSLLPTSSSNADSTSMEPPSDFDMPELEFDDTGIDLAANEVLEADEETPDFNEFQSGRITPDGLIDEDYEEELGSPAQDINVQDSIDRDFKDISSLNILQVAGDDKLGRKVVVFSACRLPAANQIDHQRLLEYIKRTLEQFVANDYCLVYFHHGLNSQNKPSLSWVRQAYRDFDRDFKKNLKNLFLVHPTGFIRFMWTLFRPIISAKFGKKMLYVNYLYELKEYFHLEQLPIPQRVLEHDRQLMLKSPPPQSLSLNDTVSAVSTSVYTPLSRPDPSQWTPRQQFGVSLQHIKANHDNSPLAPIMLDTIQYIRLCGLDVEGIFRRVASLTLVREIREKYNHGIQVDFKDMADPHLAAALLKAWLRELAEPLLTFELYDEVIRVHTIPQKLKVSAVRRIVVELLPDDNYEVLNYLVEFFLEVTSHSQTNRMTAFNLSVVFGPNLIWSRQQASLTMISHINSFTELLITHYDDIFIKHL